MRLNIIIGVVVLIILIIIIGESPSSSCPSRGPIFFLLPRVQALPISLTVFLWLFYSRRLLCCQASCGYSHHRPLILSLSPANPMDVILVFFVRLAVIKKPDISVTDFYFLQFLVRFGVPAVRALPGPFVCLGIKGFLPKLVGVGVGVAEVIQRGSLGLFSQI